MRQFQVWRIKERKEGKKKNPYWPLQQHCCWLALLLALRTCVSIRFILGICHSDSIAAGAAVLPTTPRSLLIDSIYTHVRSHASGASVEFASQRTTLRCIVDFYARHYWFAVIRLGSREWLREVERERETARWTDRDTLQLSSKWTKNWLDWLTDWQTDR